MSISLVILKLFSDLRLSDHLCGDLSPLRLMSGSVHPLKVSQELLKAYTQRRNSHLASATGDGEHSEEPDPYAFVEGDEEFSFTEKKDKSGTEREGGKKYKVGLGPTPQESSLNALKTT